MRAFTVAQANALIPWLTEVFTAVRADVDELLALRVCARGRALAARADGLRDDSDDARVVELGRRIHLRVGEVAALGLQVRRVDGMVDIPSWQGGHPVFLCWQLGEDRIRHWHPVDGGWSERQALSAEEAGARAEAN